MFRFWASRPYTRWMVGITAHKSTVLTRFSTKHVYPCGCAAGGSDYILIGTLNAKKNLVISVPIKDIIHHYNRALFDNIPRVVAYI